MKKMRIKVMRYEVRYWRLLSAGGLLFIGLGTWILFSPEKTLEFFSMLLAIGLMGTGILEILFSLINRRVVSDWKSAVIGGVIDVILGCYLLIYPSLTVIIMPIVIALWILMRTISTISDEVNTRALKLLDFLWILIASACLVLPALLILLDPLIGLLKITKLAGSVFVLSGTFRILFALHLRKLARIK